MSTVRGGEAIGRNGNGTYYRAASNLLNEPHVVLVKDAASVLLSALIPLAANHDSHIDRGNRR